MRVKVRGRDKRRDTLKSLLRTFIIYFKYNLILKKIELRKANESLYEKNLALQKTKIRLELELESVTSDNKAKTKSVNELSDLITQLRKQIETSRRRGDFFFFLFFFFYFLLWFCQFLLFIKECFSIHLFSKIEQVGKRSTSPVLHRPKPGEELFTEEKKKKKRWSRIEDHEGETVFFIFFIFMFLFIEFLKQFLGSGEKKTE